MPQVFAEIPQAIFLKWSYFGCMKNELLKLILLTVFGPGSITASAQNHNKRRNIMKNTDLSNAKLICAIIALSFFFNAAFAQWSTDPTVNNPVCTAPLDQLYPKIISDGSDGAIVTWEDIRNTNTDANIYAQRINSEGVMQWTVNGATICDATRNQDHPTITSDGSGGAIIAWADFRDISQKYQIYAQRIDSSGVVQWTANGVRICNITDGQSSPTILSDGSGGAIITWHDFRGIVAQSNIYGQKINSSGDVQWPENGVTICDATGEEQLLSIVSDGSGGAIITWQGWRHVPGETDIYAQRIDSSGVVKWNANGVEITNDSTSVLPTSASDGSGGAIITWMDFRNGTANHIYAQRIDSTGNVKWTANGVAICTAQYGGSHPTIASDGSGNSIITWEDLREGSLNFDIYGQKIDSSGIVKWIVDGVAICTATGNQVVPKIISNGSGGAIISWGDKRAGGAFGDIYAQKINASGIVQWAVDGVAISTAVKDQNTPVLVSDGSAGAIITWGDKRNDFISAYDIYTQQVNSNGDLGIVTGIAEVPGNVADIALWQNYPNPAHGKITIAFEIKNSQMVSLKVYDLFGNEVSTLVNEKKSAGKYEVDFDVSEISPGIYFYILQGSSLELIRKMIIL